MSEYPGNMSLSIICRSKDNPRKEFDEASLQELAESIREHGIIEPIVVRDIEEGAIYEIVAGERRWRAAKLAGLTSVPVRVIEADDRTALQLMLVENLQRRDLSAIETAQGYQALRELGYTVAEIAKSVGLAAPTVSNAMRLLELPEATQAMIGDGRLTPSHGRELLRFAEHPGMLEAVAELASECKLSVATLAADAPPYAVREPLVKSKVVSGDFNAGHYEQCKQCTKRVWGLCTDDACARRLAAAEESRYKAQCKQADERHAYLQTPEGKAEQRKETIERNKAIRADQAERMRYLRDGHVAPGWERRALVVAVRGALSGVYADEARILGGVVGGELGELISKKQVRDSHLEPLSDDALMQLLWEAEVARNATMFEWSADNKIGEIENYLRGTQVEPSPSQTEAIPEPDPEAFHVECPLPTDEVLIEGHEEVGPEAEDHSWAWSLSVGDQLVRTNEAAYRATVKEVFPGTVVVECGTLGEYELAIEEVIERFRPIEEAVA